VRETGIGVLGSNEAQFVIYSYRRKQHLKIAKTPHSSISVFPPASVIVVCYLLLL